MSRARAWVLFLVLALVLPMWASAQEAPPPAIFTMDRAVQYALDHYPTVRAALEQINVSTAGVSVARSAYLPRLDSLWQSNRGTANNVFGQVLPQSVIPAMSGPVLSSASGGSRPTLARLRRLSLALVFCVSILPFFVGPLAAALGNDDPLNGRTKIWAGVATMLSERPLTGYGYEVVWRRRKATRLPEIEITAQRSSTSAHNSILDIAAELGIPAAIVACFFLFTALVETARLFEREPSDFSLFALLFTLGIVVMGFTEAHLFRIHSMLWIMFVALIVAVSRSLERLEPASSGGISA